MQIKIPIWMVHGWSHLDNWANSPLIQYKRLELYYIDVLLVTFGVLGISWYWWYYNWISALQNGVAYVAIVALCIFVRGRVSDS